MIREESPLSKTKSKSLALGSVGPVTGGVLVTPRRLSVFTQPARGFSVPIKHMQVEIKDGKLVITLPINPAVSKTGKSEVIATTHGNVKTSTTYKDKPVTVGVNAYVSR